MRYALLLLLFLCSATAEARPVIADLSVRSIYINTRFEGIDILLFGARRDTGDIVVAVRGPEKNFLVRQKERVAGIWMHTSSAVFSESPSFYAVASSKPLPNFANQSLLSSLGLLQPEFKISRLAKMEDLPKFEQALTEYQQQRGLVAREIKPVTFWGETLFRTILRFPENIPGGWYTVETYLFDEDRLISVQSTPLYVSKVGFEAFMYNLAHRYKTLYGFVCVALALSAGWAASLVFRRI